MYFYHCEGDPQISKDRQRIEVQELGLGHFDLKVQRDGKTKTKTRNMGPREVNSKVKTTNKQTKAGLSEEGLPHNQLCEMLLTGQ